MQAFHHLHDRARDVLGSLGLWAMRDEAVSTLSYGDQRQLEIALALATRPRLLLLDEPTAGLSPAETQGVMQIVRHLPREMTILLIEHDMSVVFGVCDRIVVLHHGEMVADAAPDAIRQDRRVREIYLGQAL
jgi:branched-chain amino acid transport system ATP-binding protein